MKTRSLKIILIVAAGLRLALLAAAWNSPGRMTTPDSADYVELANSLSGSATFQRDQQPEIFRTPGYPVFMVFASVFGRHWLHAAAFGQILVDVTLVYLTYLLGSVIYNSRTGLIAAGFQAIAAVSIVSSVRILSDSIFAFMLVLAVLMLAFHFRTNKLWPLMSAACIAGLSCYLRPVGLMFCGVGGVALLFRKRGLAKAAPFAAIVVAVVAPWVVRNMWVADYTGFSSFASDSMFAYSAPAVLAQEKALDQIDAASQMALAERAYLYSLRPNECTAGRMASYRRREALKVIADHPATYAKIHFRGAMAVWLPGITDVMETLDLTIGQKGTLRVLNEEGLMAGVRHYFAGKAWLGLLCLPAVVILAIKYILVITCAIGRLRLPMGWSGWLLLLTILSFALVGGPATTPRFRTPIEPLLSIVASGGMALVLEWLARTGHGHKVVSEQSHPPAD